MLSCACCSSLRLSSLELGNFFDEVKFDLGAEVGCGRLWCVSTQNVPVCTFKTSPCVLAPRPHVETHVRMVAGIHGDVLNVHTGTC